VLALYYDVVQYLKCKLQFTYVGAKGRGHVSPTFKLTFLLVSFESFQVHCYASAAVML